MLLKPLSLAGSYEIALERIGDDRGFFMRFYDREIFAEYDLQTAWEQESVSFNSARGTLRGLHFQKPPFVESKLVRVVAGAIMDVFVDLRKDSETFGEWHSVELSAENDMAVYIPKGFAHGFCTLRENTMVEYKIDVSYKAELADGIRWNDKTLGIEWDVDNPIISERDSKLGFFADFDSPFLTELKILQ